MYDLLEEGPLRTSSTARFEGFPRPSKVLSRPVFRQQEDMHANARSLIRLKKMINNTRELSTPEELAGQSDTQSHPRNICLAVDGETRSHAQHTKCADDGPIPRLHAYGDPNEESREPVGVGRQIVFVLSHYCSTSKNDNHVHSGQTMIRITGYNCHGPQLTYAR